MNESRLSHNWLMAVSASVLTLLILCTTPVDAATGRRAVELIGDLQTEREVALLVIDRSARAVLFLDPKTYALTAEVPTGGDPQEVVVSSDGQYAFVSVAADGDRGDSAIQVIATESRETVARIPLGAYRIPRGLAVTRDGERLYVVVEDGGALLEIALEARTVARVFKTGQQGSQTVVLNPAQRTAYVANSTSGTVTMINLTSGALQQIRTGAGAEGLAIRRRGRELWVANRRANTITIVDQRTGRVREQFACAGGPARLAFMRGERFALVTCATSGEVAVVDAQTKAIVRRVSVGESPVGVLVPAQGSRAFVANTTEGTVTVVDITRWIATARLAIGERVQGLALAAVGRGRVVE